MTTNPDDALFEVLKRLADKYNWELSKRDPGPIDTEIDTWSDVWPEMTRTCIWCGATVTEEDEGDCPNPDCPWMLARQAGADPKAGWSEIKIRLATAETKRLMSEFDPW